MGGLLEVRPPQLASSPSVFRSKLVLLLLLLLLLIFIEFPASC